MQTMSRTTYIWGALLSLTVLAQPAEARRFRIFGIPHFGGGESIEKVYDLPDKEPFVKDGDNLDLGYLHGQTKSGFVLFVGDRYRLLDQSQISMMSTLIGFDPTAKYRADHAEENAAAAAEAKAEREHKDELIAKGQMIERAPGESRESYAARSAEFIRKARERSASRQTSGASAGSGDPLQQSSGSLWGSGTIVFIGLLAILAFSMRRKILGLAFGAGQAASQMTGAAGDTMQPSVNYESFDERVARQLAARQEGADETSTATGVTNPTSMVTPRAPIARGFGRKLA
jgi:hypothetical protein